MAFSPLPIVDFNRNPLDVSPLTDAINNRTNVQFKRNALDMDQQRLDMAKGQDARAAELHPIQLKAANQQLSQSAAAEGRQAAMHPLQVSRAQQEVSAGQDEATKRKAGIYAGFIEEKFINPAAPVDPETKSANWLKVLNGPLKDMAHLNDPEIGPLLRDPEMGPRMVLNIARGYQDPLARKKVEADINKDTQQARLYGAQADAAGRKGTGMFETPKDMLKYEQDLREEFNKQPAVKEFGTVRDAYSKVQGAAQDKSAAGDISMIFAYMKMLDPASTVREGEFATAQNATGVPGQVQNLYNQIMSGNRLNDAQRLDFISQANKLFSVHDRQYGAVRGQYSDLAKRAGIDPSRVTLDHGKFDDGQKSPYGTGPARPDAAPEQGAVPRFDAPPRSTGPAQQQSNQPKQAPDGYFYIPDPSRPGKYLRVDQ